MEDYEFYYDTGIKYFYGNGVRKDFGIAAWWFRRAANLGSIEATYMLGEIFLLAEENFRNPDITWFTREDEVYRNVRCAFYWFTQCYNYCSYKMILYERELNIRERLRFYGFGLDLNDENTFEFFLEAIKLPRREEIMYQTGRKYFKGLDGKSKDINTASFWLMKAAEHGSTAAAFMLGEIYRKGEGVERNIDMAVYWYKKAKERDYLKAMYKIGKMYRDGKSIEKNLEKACYYFEEVLQNLKWSVL